MQARRLDLSFELYSIRVFQPQSSHFQHQDIYSHICSQQQSNSINIPFQKHIKTSFISKMQEDKLSQRTSSICKQLATFQDKIHDCQHLIINRLIVEAIDKLQDIIFHYQHFLNVNPFRAIGNIENWRFCCSEGPYQWFEQANKSNELTGNPFDLLNFCYVLQLQEKTMTLDEVLSEYQKLSAKNKNKLQTEIGLGNVFYQQGLYSEARQHYLQAIENDKECENALEYLAWVHHIFENRKLAFDYAKKAKKLNPRNKQALLIGILNQTGDHIFTLTEQLELLAKMYPEYYRIYLELGKRSNSFEEGKMWIERAFKFENSPPIKAAFLEVRFRFKNDLQELKEQLSKEMEKSNCWEFHDLMAQIKQAQSNHDAAIEEWKKALQLSPNRVDIYVKMTRVYFNLKQYNVAITWLQRGEKLNPDDESFPRRIGVCFNRMGRLFYNDMFESLKRAMSKENNNSFQCARYLGRCYQHFGNYHKAIEMYVRANQIDPQNDYLCTGIYKCYKLLNQNKLAQEQADRILTKGTSQQKLKMYEALARQAKMEVNDISALKWMLKLQNQQKNYLPSVTIQIFLGKMKESQAKSTLINVALSESRERENIYAILQLAFACKNLNMNEQFDQLYNIAWCLTKNQRIPIILLEQMFFSVEWTFTFLISLSLMEVKQIKSRDQSVQ